jgi:hypothetical protein
MRNLSFHVPQAKEQILLNKFPAQASLTVDPASPRAPNDIYSTFKQWTDEELVQKNEEWI